MVIILEIFVYKYCKITTKLIKYCKDSNPKTLRTLDIK